MEAVLGLDACPAGWVGVVLAHGTGEVIGTVVAPDVGSAYGQALDLAGGALAVVGVDIPIGLPDSGVRAADRLARMALGPRRSSVFVTPVRAALLAATHAEGTRISVAATGAGMSMQAYRLGPKVLEVDTWCRSVDVEVREVHPELSFAELAGAPLTYPKKTWGGMSRRRALLAGAGVVLDDQLGPASAVPVDDVLDAAVAAWSARRVARGEARSLPDPPEVAADGWPGAIWV